MNSNLKNLIYAVSSIVIILPAILFTSDYIYFQEPLTRVALYPDDPKINKELTEQLGDDYKCVEIKPDEFVCRLERGDTFGDLVKSSSAGPISYGEIVSFPEGKSDTQWFNIENMKILDKNSKIIQVDFNDSKGDDMPSNIIYTTKLKPNDTFLSCVNPWKSTHLVQYMDLYEYENKTYAEFWGLHPFTPPELFPCDMPKIIETSLKINYDIPLPEYDQFGFDIQKEYDTTYDDREPKFKTTSTNHQELIDAKNKLSELYQNNISLGSFHIKDAIVGYDMGDGFLVVDILKEYYDSVDDRELIMQKIIDITGGKIEIAFNSTVVLE